MTIQKIISKLQDAERAGVGGLQRDRLESAFKMVAEEYIQSMTEAGNKASESAESLIVDVVDVFDKNFKGNS